MTFSVLERGEGHGEAVLGPGVRAVGAVCGGTARGVGAVGIYPIVGGGADPAGRASESLDGRPERGGVRADGGGGGRVLHRSAGRRVYQLADPPLGVVVAGLSAPVGDPRAGAARGGGDGGRAGAGTVPGLSADRAGP